MLTGRRRQQPNIWAGAARLAASGRAALPSSWLIVDDPTFYNATAQLHAGTSIAPPATLSLVVTPPNPSIPATTPPGATVATLQGVWSDGAAFAGSYQFVPPNYDHGGVYAISGNRLIINPAGPGVGSAGGSIQDVTIQAVQS